MSIKSVVTAVLILIASSLVSVAANATNVRGRVDIGSPRGFFPMSGAFVELCSQQYPNCQSYRTGYDGMYYFSATPGSYFIRVNGVFRINLIVPNAPYYDVLPVICC